MWGIKRNTIKIEKWAVVEDSGKLRLQGEVSGHHRHDDGKKVTTSSVVAADKKIVQTRSGSLYELGEPEPEFVAYISEVGSALDWEEPLALYEGVEKLKIDPYRLN